jgi:hypothetical protein
VRCLALGKFLRCLLLGKFCEVFCVRGFCEVFGVRDVLLGVKWPKLRDGICEVCDVESFWSIPLCIDEILCISIMTV